MKDKENNKTSNIKNTKKTTIIYDLTHAQFEPSHSLSGLFRAIKKGERKNSKLDITYNFGGKKQIEFKGMEPLGADDLRVLQGLIGLAGVNGLILNFKPKTSEGKVLREKMEFKWDAVQEKAIMVKTSYSKLMKEIGYINTHNTKVVQNSIERLWMTAIIVQNEAGKRMGFRLLSNYASDDSEFYIALNPLITYAILGGQHVYINMDEVRTLRSDAARLIHQRLCSWIDSGKFGRIETDTLCSYVWTNTSTNPNTVKTRRQTVKKALAELTSIGWTVKEYAKDKWKIERPKIIQ